MKGETDRAMDPLPLAIFSGYVLYVLHGILILVGLRGGVGLLGSLVTGAGAAAVAGSETEAMWECREVLDGSSPGPGTRPSGSGGVGCLRLVSRRRRRRAAIVFLRGPAAARRACWIA